MIKMQNVSKIYHISENLFYALDNVSIEIHKGEMVAICGRSGAGKSTLLHILGFLDTFEKGKYYFNNKDVSSINNIQMAKIRNETIGFILQDFSLINHRSVLYNVEVPMLFNKTPVSLMKDKAMQALDQMNMASHAKKDVVNLSGGQRQRVAIARAIVNNPSVILADEPTGNLDSITSKDIIQVFQELHRIGTTVIIVTHDEKVAKCCDRIISIYDGKII